MREARDGLTPGPAEERLSRREKVALISESLFHPDAARRLLAIKSIGASRDPWLARLLLYKLGDEEREVVREAEAALRERGAELAPLYLAELSSPSPEVRAAATRLLGQCARLDRVQPVAERLFDYHVAVRDAARTALRRIIERCPEDAGEPGADAAVRGVMPLFAELAGSPDLGVRHLALELLLALGRLFPAPFWAIYEGLDLRRRKLLHLELLRVKSLPCLALIYHGMCHPNPEVRSAVASLIFNNVDQEDLNDHLAVVGGLTPDEQRGVAELYREHQILPRLLRVAGWLKQPARLTLIRLLGYLDAMEYRDFFVDCLNLTDRETRIAILRIAEQYPLEVPRDKILQLLREGDDELTVAVLRFLEVKGSFELVRDMVGYFSAESESVRTAALAAVFRVARDFLLERYDHLRPSARDDLARFLQKMNEQFAVELARPLAELPEDERLRNVEILARLGDEPDVRPLLDELTRHPDEKVRATAARALPRYPDPERVGALLSLLCDEDSRVRANAIEELPEDAVSDEILALLARSAESSNNRERATALSKLLGMGRQDCQARLAEMLDSEDPWVRASGLWALARSAASPLADRARDLLEDSSPSVRRMALYALGSHAPLEEIRGLTRFLLDTDSAVRRAARDVLRRRLRIDYEVAP